MPELVDDFLRRAVKEKLAVGRCPVEGRVKAAKRDERHPARALGLAENEVEVARAGVEVGGEQCEHSVFASYPVQHPLKNQVCIVLVTPSVICGRWHLK